MIVNGENPSENINTKILKLAYDQNDFYDQKRKLSEEERRFEAEEFKMLQALLEPNAPVGDELIAQYADIIGYYSDRRRVLLLEEALRFRDRLKAGERIMPTAAELEIDTIMQAEGDGATEAQPFIDKKKLILAWQVRTNRHPGGIAVTDKTIVGHNAITDYLDTRASSVIHEPRAGSDASAWRQD